MADNGKAKNAKKVFAWVLTALIAAGVGIAIWTGQRYGLFSELMPDLPSVPDGFFDENSAQAFVEFIDVGEGDAALIGTDGHYMLIDTGPRDDSDLLINTLVREGVTRLDYLVLTHPHEDHIGEAAEIITQFTIGCVIAPEVPDELNPDTYAYGSFIEAVNGSQLSIHTAADEHFKLGSCTFDTYVPQNAYDELNNYSVIVRFCHGDNTFLFTGDSEQPEEEELIGRGVDLSADVLKAGHHGGRDSCCAEFLAAVQPKYTVISCGAENDNGHPNRDTLRRIQRFSPKVLLTPESGNVRFESTGSKLKVTESKERKSKEDSSESDTVSESADIDTGSESEVTFYDEEDDGYYDAGDNDYYDDGAYYADDE